MTEPLFADLPSVELPLPTKSASSESSSNEAVTPVLLVQASTLLPVPETKLTAAHYRRFRISIGSVVSYP